MKDCQETCPETRFEDQFSSWSLADKVEMETWEAYVVAGSEFAYFHGPNEIDVRLTTAIQNEIGQSLKDQRVKSRPRPSEWIAITLRKEEDVEFALQMIEQAWRANGGHQARSA